MRRSSEVALGETLAFVAAHALPAPARILEVGCGDGALAARLLAAGHQVVALDASEEAVAAARGRGVDAVLATWPQFEAAPFDLVLFSRSLHHLHPLKEAIARARALLRPGGCVLAEDFAYSDIDALSAEWLRQILALLHAAGLLAPEEDGFASALIASPDALAAWRAHHDHHHPLHPADVMLARLKDRFSNVQVRVVPYLYRYVAEALPEGEAGDRLARRVLGLESRMAEAAGVGLIGRRFITRT